MKKTYETPQAKCILLNLSDIVTVSDNDTSWDSAWNDVIT